MDAAIVFQAVLALLVMVGLGIVVAVIFVGVAWYPTKGLVWILSRPMAQKFMAMLQQKWLAWWAKNHELVEYLWEFASEILIEPLFYVYAAAAFVNKLASIADYTSTHPEYVFWEMLNQDMERNMNFYVGLYIVFVLWMFGRAFAHRQRRREQRALTKTLEAQTQILQAIAKKLDASVGDTGDERPNQ